MASATKTEIIEALIYALDEIGSRSTPPIDLQDENEVTPEFVKKHHLLFDPLSREMDMVPEWFLVHADTIKTGLKRLKG